MAFHVIGLSLGAIALSFSSLSLAAEPPSEPAVIHAEPLNPGRVSPKLFGNFVELLDDVVPGMWAEMLNDRSFEGVTPMRPPFYFDGSPTTCDRDWDRNPTWKIDTNQPFEGLRSAKMTSAPGSPARLTQSGLSAKPGMDYSFSGYFRADSENLKATVSLKTLMPDGASFVCPHFTRAISPRVTNL